jgi:hypothetical protein
MILVTSLRNYDKRINSKKEEGRKKKVEIKEKEKNLNIILLLFLSQG